MLKLINEGFNKLEKYIVIKGENYNQDRCIVVPVKLNENTFDITMCMDELENEAKVCQIDGEDIASELKLLAASALNELKKAGDIAVYTPEDEEKYSYYLEEIKMVTECCEGKCANCSYYNN